MKRILAVLAVSVGLLGGTSAPAQAADVITCNKNNPAYKAAVKDRRVLVNPRDRRTTCKLTSHWTRAYPQSKGKLKGYWAIELRLDTGRYVWKQKIVHIETKYAWNRPRVVLARIFDWRPMIIYKDGRKHGEVFPPR